MADRPSREEVLAWMAANQAGLGAASKRFGIPKATLADWRRAARSGEPTRTRPDTGTPPTLTVINTPAPLPPKALPRSFQGLARRALRMHLKRLTDKDAVGSCSLRDSAAIVSALTDRFPALGDLKNPALVAKEPDLSTPEGEDELVAQLRALPPGLVRRAMEGG